MKKKNFYRAEEEIIIDAGEPNHVQQNRIPQVIKFFELREN